MGVALRMGAKAKARNRSAAPSVEPHEIKSHYSTGAALCMLLVLAAGVFSKSLTHDSSTPALSASHNDKATVTPIALNFQEANERMNRELAKGNLCDSLKWLDPACADAATVVTCPEPLRFNYAILLETAGRK